MTLKRLKDPPKDRILLRDTPADYTSPDGAPERVLLINLGIMKYGTTDRLQGAALFLAVILICLVIVLYISSLIKESPDLFNHIFPWVANVFALVVGVAIGRGGGSAENGEKP